MCANGLTASSATSQTRSGDSPLCTAPVRIARWSRLSEAVRSEPGSMLPLSIAWWMCSAASPAPPSASALHRPSSVGLNTAPAAESARRPKRVRRASASPQDTSGQRELGKPTALEPARQVETSASRRRCRASAGSRSVGRRGWRSSAAGPNRSNLLGKGPKSSRRASADGAVYQPVLGIMPS